MRQHLIHRPRPRLDVFVFTFEDAEVARDYAHRERLPWPVIVDESRRIYRAYDMDRATLWQVWGLHSAAAYAAELARGRIPRPPVADTRQRGGDVLIDPAGRIVLHHVGRDPADRPAVERLLAPVPGPTNDDGPT